MKDYLVRIIAKEAGVRGLACVTTDLVAEGGQRHATTPTATAALGRALTAATLAGALLKVRQRVALKYDGNGPLGKIITESDAYGHVRGYVANPRVEVERHQEVIDIAGAIGAGELLVVRDVLLPDLMRTVVQLQTSEVDDDLAFYYNQSEQVATLVEIGVALDDEGVVTVAGGLLLQALADQGAETIALLAERLQELPPVEDVLRTRTPEQLLADILGDISYDVLEERDVTFRCSCSYERSVKALISLGRVELEQLLANGEAVVDCHFCHERYSFTANDLEAILADLD